MSNKKRKIRTGFLLALLALALGAIALRRPSPTVAAWFNDSWLYRKAIAITNSSGGALTDFQVSFTIDTTDTTRFQADCDDIRVTDVNGDLLPHWIETGDNACGTATTKVWTKVPSLPTSGATIYVYYGNPTATGTQSGDKVFEFFDDFSGSSINSVKWNTSGSPAVSAGILSLSNSGALSSKTGVTGASGLGQMIVRAKQAVVNLSGGKIGFSSTNTLASDFHAADSLSVNFGNTEEKLTDFGSSNKVAHFKLEETSLATGDPIDDASSNDADLQVVTGATSATGKINNGLTFNGSTQYLKQQVIDDQVGSSWGPTVHGLSLAANSAFMRVQGVDLSPYASAGNDYMIVVSDGEGDKAWGYIDNADVAEALGSELRTNTSFETFTGTPDDGVSDDIDAWVEVNNDANGNKIEATTTANSGTYAVKITYGTGAAELFSTMNSLTQGKLYKYSFYTRGDNSKAGQYHVYDLTHSAHIIENTSTGVSGTTYQKVSAYFTVPSGCTQVVLYLRSPSSAGTAYFDDVSLKEVTDVGTDGVHIMSTKGGSTQSWAGISASFNYNASAYTFEVRETEFQITGNLTVGAWVKTASIANTRTIFSKSDGAANSWAVQHKANGKIDYYKVGAVDIETTNTVSTGDWHFIAVVNSSGTVSIYVDGTLAGGPTGGASLDDLRHSFIIGQLGDGTNYYSGTIDEPFVISSALTADQIKALYEYYTISTSHTATKTTPANTADGTNDTNYHVYTLSSLSASSTLVQDSTTLSTSTTNLPAVAQYARLQNTDTTNALSVDWIAVIKPATASPTTSLSSTEEQGGGPVAYWSFDDGSGTVAQDKTSNNNDGTLGTGSSSPSWQDESMCVSGKCLKFDNIDDTVSVTNSISGIKTVSFWVKPNTTTEYFVDLNGSAYISSTSGAISATGFTAPIYYVNGKSVTSPILTANQWNYITVTTTTGLTGSAIRLGKIGTNHLQGFLDDIKIYPYARTAAQIKLDYNGRGTAKGSSATLGVNNSSIQPFNNSLSNGLVGYWNMDTGSGTTAPDLSGNSNTATLGAGDSAPTWASAKFGSGLSFDGNDYARVTHASSIEPTEELTYSAWIYPTSVSGNNAIVSKNDVNVSAWRLKTLYLNGDEVYFWVFNGSSQYFNTTNADLAINTWYHIMVTVKDNNFVKIYVNGIEKYSNTAVGDLLLTENEDLMIGANLNTNIPGYLFDGLIDEVRIYNRSLSPAEVGQLYEWAPGPQAYFKLDDGSGTSPVDSSGFSRTGTVVNGTWTTGKVGKGLKLDGSGDYLQITDF